MRYRYISHNVYSNIALAKKSNPSLIKVLLQCLRIRTGNYIDVMDEQTGMIWTAYRCFQTPIRYIDKQFLYYRYYHLFQEKDLVGRSRIRGSFLFFVHEDSFLGL